MKIVWLIEPSSAWNVATLYVCKHDDETLSWTSRVQKAAQFKTKAEAEEFAKDKFNGGVLAVEHEFL